MTLLGPRGEGTVSVFVGQETKAWGQHVFPENGGPWGGAGVCATVEPGIFVPPTACPDTCPASGSPGSASLALISQGPRASTSVTEGGEPGYRPAPDCRFLGRAQAQQVWAAAREVAEVPGSLTAECGQWHVS